MTVYYAKPSGSDNADGLTVGTAWKTISFGAGQLGPGDELHLLDGTYTAFADMGSGTHQSGTAVAPITIKAAEGSTPVITAGGGIEITNLDYWVLDGLVFNNNPAFTFGSAPGANFCNYWTIKNCRWEHCHRDTFSGTVALRGANNFSFLNCEFDNLRSRQAGKDTFAILIGDVANDLLVQDCTFTDIGGDGIQSGAGTTMNNLVVRRCTFKIIRPYQYRAPVTGAPGADPGMLVPAKNTSYACISVGENGIDLKAGTNPLIENCTFIGYRPAVPDSVYTVDYNPAVHGYPVDCSGAPFGSAVTLQQTTTGGIIRRCTFIDNCTHIRAGGALLDEVSNCIFLDANDEMLTYRPTGTTLPAGISIPSINGIKIENNIFHNSATPANYAHIHFETSAQNLTIRNNVFDNGIPIRQDGFATFGGTNVINYNAWANIVTTLDPEMSGANDVTSNTLGLTYGATVTIGGNSVLVGAGTNTGYATDRYGNSITSYNIGGLQALIDTVGADVRVWDGTQWVSIKQGIACPTFGFGEALPDPSGYAENDVFFLLAPV